MRGRSPAIPCAGVNSCWGARPEDLGSGQAAWALRVRGWFGGRGLEPETRGLDVGTCGFLPSSGGELGSWEAGLRVLHARQRVRGLAPRGRRAVLLAVLLVSRERRKLVLPSPPEPLHPLRDPPLPHQTREGAYPPAGTAFQAESPGCRGPVSKPALGTEAGGVADTKMLGWCRVGCVPRPCSRGSWPGSRSLSGWAEGGAGGRDAGPRPRPVQASAGLWEAEEGLRGAVRAHAGQKAPGQPREPLCRHAAHISRLS